MRIIILSPNKYSYYTLAISEILLKEGFKIDAIVYLKFSINRIKNNIFKSPVQIFVKFLKKVLFRKVFYKSQDTDNGLYYYRKKIGINSNSIEHFTKFGTKIFSYNDFNSHDCINQMNLLEPDLILFTGGGIIKSELLKIPKIGILNSHMGILPFYRGMHVAEWTLLNKDYDNLGCTTHLMEKNVDTGKIINIQRIKIENINNIDELYSLFEKNMCLSLLSSCKLLEKNKNFYLFISESTPLYFSMPDKLLNIIKNSLKNRTYEN
jgi:methionyl-tRNA formyltransferase